MKALSNRSRVGMSVAFGFMLGQLIYPSSTELVDRVAYALVGGAIIILATFVVTWLTSKPSPMPKEKTDETKE